MKLFGVLLCLFDKLFHKTLDIKLQHILLCISSLFHHLGLFQAQHKIEKIENWTAQIQIIVLVSVLVRVLVQCYIILSFGISFNKLITNIVLTWYTIRISAGMFIFKYIYSLMLKYHIFWVLFIVLHLLWWLSEYFFNNKHIR